MGFPREAKMYEVRDLYKAGARIRRTGDSATSEATLERFIAENGLSGEMAQAARQGYRDEAEMGASGDRRDKPLGKHQTNA
jgi:hypothetical protein